MRVCILTHTFPRFKKDVVAPFMDGLAEGVRSAGNEVFVLTPYNLKFKREKKDQKYKIITYKYVWPDFLHLLGYSETLSNDMTLKPIMWFLSPFMYLFGIIALYKLVKKEKIDLINAHWILPNGFMACAVSKITGIPVVSTLPGSDVYMAQKNWLFSWMARFAARVSMAVTSNSPQLLKDLAAISEKNMRLRGQIQKKFLPIIYGVDPDKFRFSLKEVSKIKNKLSLSVSDTVILGVGRLVAKKGFKYLIMGSSKVIKKYPNTRFILIGEGDQRLELENLVERLKVKNNFKFLGWVNYESLVNYYSLADIFILPSVRDEEGNLDDQSVSVVEAMSCGKPVITTNFPGYRLVVKNGENGYLVPEKDSSKITKTIQKLIASKVLRKRMGRKSRKIVLERFSWEVIGNQYSELFSKLL